MHRREALFPLFVALLEGFCWNAFRLVVYALLDIIQSTKMAPFQVVSEPGEQNEVAKNWDPANIRGWGTTGMPFPAKKWIDGDCRVTWAGVEVQHPSACNAWLRTSRPPPKPFEDFPVKSLMDKLAWRHRFFVYNPLTLRKKKKKKKSVYWFLIWWHNVAQNVAGQLA